MLNFDFLDKGLGIVSSAHFVYEFSTKMIINNAPLTYVYPNTIKTYSTPNQLLFGRQLLCYSNPTSAVIRNLTILSSTTDNPANIPLDEDVLKTFFVFVFKRRFQDVLTKANVFALLISLQKRS